MTSSTEPPVVIMNFGVHKKNARGRYQYRKLQFDFTAQMLHNMEGDTDQTKRSFTFREICLLKRDADNPLSFLVAFRDSTPFHIYARSRRDADIMVETVEKIIENNKKTTETQCYFQFVELKKGSVMQKTQMGYQKRWLVLYKWQLVIKREEGDNRPTTIRAIYNVPLAKFTDKQENGQLAHLIAVLFDDEQLVFRFDSQEIRDQWFSTLLSASQDDKSLSTIPEEHRELKTKSKDQIKVEQEMEELRSEKAALQTRDTELKEEKQKQTNVVDEIKGRCTAAENEVQRLTLSISTLDEEKKQMEENIKKSEKNIKEDDAKKQSLEDELKHLNNQIDDIQLEIKKFEVEIHNKQKQLEQVEMGDSEVVQRKRAIHSTLNEGERKIIALRVEQQDTQKKTLAKELHMDRLEKEIEGILNEITNVTADKETQMQLAAQKEKAQTEVLNHQKATITSRVKELETEANNSKEAYDSVVVQRNVLMDNLKSKQQKRL